MPVIIKNWSAISSISLTLVLLALQGCSTTPNVVPATGPDTLEVYQNHVAGIKSDYKSDLKGNKSDKTKDKCKDPVIQTRAVQSGDRDLVGYTRDTANEINLRFPRLPNPEMVIYIFPHINDKGRPIPGYSTSFLMYEKDEYAMPGEIAP
jgi:conjugative transfer region lipoprotein (TIGR03751 family)